MIGNRIVPFVVASSFVLLVLPVAALAQSSIAGVVKDTSGAVLPGVQVDASSPVLIEQTRSVITDSQGVYRIIDLRPGTYKVTFTLPGFATFEREGIRVGPATRTTSRRRVAASDVAGGGEAQDRHPVQQRRELPMSSEATGRPRYGASWLNVTGVLPPRMVKLGVQVDF